MTLPALRVSNRRGSSVVVGKYSPTAPVIDFPASILKIRRANAKTANANRMEMATINLLRMSLFQKSISLRMLSLFYG